MVGRFKQRKKGHYSVVSVNYCNKQSSGTTILKDMAVMEIWLFVAYCH